MLQHNDTSSMRMTLIILLTTTEQDGEQPVTPTCCCSCSQVKVLSSYLLTSQVLQRFLCTAGLDLSLRRVLPPSLVSWRTPNSLRAPGFLTGFWFAGPRGAGAPLPNAQGIKVNGFALKRALDAAKQAAVFLPRHLVSGAGSGEVNRQLVLRLLPVCPALCHGGALQVTEEDGGGAAGARRARARACCVCVWRAVRKPEVPLWWCMI